ncbi:MAG TPA: hypothetical protein VIN93_06690 [Bryobacteraceae bacterium]|jgi:hypothetical protein
MYALIRLCDGTIVEAVVLAHTPSWMRVAAAGLDDVAELRLCGSDWLDEHNEPVQFSFLLATDNEEAPALSLPQAVSAHAC